MVSLRVRNVLVTIGCVGLVGGMAYVPFISMRSMQPLQDRDGPLTGSQRMRGLYQNNGSVDIGRDPDWDLSTRKWKGKRNPSPATLPYSVPPSHSSSSSSSSSEQSS
eukprot:gene6295-6941_t